MATTNGTSGTMERILRLMSEKKASDVYLSAHSPALIRINGQCVPINSQVLPPDAPRNLLAEVLPPERIEELEELNELNMGFPLAGVGRFRISAMRQRGTIAAVIRCLAAEMGEYGVRANVVAPGLIITPMMGPSDGPAVQYLNGVYAPITPMKRTGTAASSERARSTSPSQATRAAASNAASRTTKPSRVAATWW